MTRRMFDAVSPGALPRSAVLVAGYDDGLYNNVAKIRAQFPHALLVDITVSSRHNWGHVLDVETGDATAAEAPGWVLMRRAAGVDPSVYCNSSTWPSVRAAFRAAGVAEPHYWIARYDGDPTIPAGAVAKQYLNTPGWDESSVADYWPGVDPAPTSTPTPPEDIVTPQDKKDIAAAVLAELPAVLAAVPAAVWDYNLTRRDDQWKPQKVNPTLAAHWFIEGKDVTDRQRATEAAELKTEVTALTAQVAALVKLLTPKAGA